MGSPVDNVMLQDCCRQTLAKIHEKQELGKLLKGVLAVTPWVLIIGAHPIEAAFSLGTTDWEALGTAIRSVNVIVRRACLNEVALEFTTHTSGQLGQFWAGMYEQFGG